MRPAHHQGHTTTLQQQQEQQQQQQDVHQHCQDPPQWLLQQLHQQRPWQQQRLEPYNIARQRFWSHIPWDAQHAALQGLVYYRKRCGVCVYWNKSMSEGKFMLLLRRMFSLLLARNGRIKLAWAMQSMPIQFDTWTRVVFSQEAEMLKVCSVLSHKTVVNLAQ